MALGANIKGITLEIGADTTKLGDAIDSVTGESKALQSELKKVDNLLKFNPGNADLLAQKQEILSKNVETTTKKLDALRSAQSDVDKLFASGKINDKQYREFQRTVIDTAGSLNTLKTKLGEVESAQKTAASKMLQFGDALKESSGKAKTFASDVSKSVSVGGAAIAGSAVGLVQSSSELNTMLARLSTNAYLAGADMAIVEQGLADVTAVSGDSRAAVETVSNVLAAGVPDNKLLEALDLVNAGAIKFSDTLNTEGIADGIQETFATGEAIGMFAELLERSGIDLDDFNEKLGAAKTEAEKTDLVLQTLSDVGLGDVTDKYKELNPEVSENAEANFELEKAMADLAIVLTPLVTEMTKIIEKVVTWATENPKLAETMVIIGTVVSAIATAFTVLMPIISGIMSLFRLLRPIIMAAGVGFAWLPLVIAAVIAIGIALYKNWDVVSEKLVAAWGWIKDKALELWALIKEYIIEPIKKAAAFVVEKVGEMKDKAVEKFNTLRDKAKEIFGKVQGFIEDPIGTARDFVKKKIDEIKGFFTNLKLKIPAIELPSMPKITLETATKTILKKKITYPTGFNIEWKDEGGIFYSPTVIGVGEKRPEFVGALEDLEKIVSASMLGVLNEFGTSNTSSTDGAIRALTDALRESNTSNRPINLTLNIDGHEFAKATYQDITSLQANATARNARF